MIKKLLFLCIVAFSGNVQAQQFVINEVDSDNPSTDTLEFVEIKSTTPNASLNNHVLVFYNGGTTGNNALKVYYAVSLHGLTTDVNGLVLIGNVGVMPTPARIIPNSTIQNGPDAIAIYQGDISDFDVNTPVSQVGLVHAVAHGTATTQPTDLMLALGITAYGNENSNGNNKTTHSILRNNTGGYYADTPTPGVLNDGSGILFNGLSIGVDPNDKTEGTSFDITFTLQQPATSNLNIIYSLDNGNFNVQDYKATLNVSIPIGQTTVSTTVQLLNDGVTEGDEMAKIVVNTLPQGYQVLNNMMTLNIIDANYIVSNFGTPLNPTYGQVKPTIPNGYYTSLDGLSGQALKDAIKSIIADSTLVRKRVYADLPTFLKEADQNPANSNEVWLMYTEQPRAKNLYQLSSSGTGYWNREHIYPQSRGGFANGTNKMPSGVDYWESTNAADIMAGHSDAHHIRAEDAPTNSSRNNKDFGSLDYNGPLNNMGSWKGDVARALFFMASRYDVLELVDGNPDDSTPNKIGDLATLLSWNTLDASDDFEMNRNNIIFDWQKNRNPYIDLPDLAEYVFGSLQNVPYKLSLNTKDQWYSTFKMYPNPAVQQVTFEGIENANVIIYNMVGQKLKSFYINNHHTESLSLPTGMYQVQILKEGNTHTQKLMIK